MQGPVTHVPRRYPADIPRRAASKTSASDPLAVPRLAVQLHLLQESPCLSTLSLTAPRRLRQQAPNPLHSASHGRADTAFTDTSRALLFQLALRKTIIRSITVGIVASDPAGRHAHPTCQEASETWAALPSPRRTQERPNTPCGSLQTSAFCDFFLVTNELTYRN